MFYYTHSNLFFLRLEKLEDREQFQYNREKLYIKLSKMTSSFEQKKRYTRSNHLKCSKRPQTVPKGKRLLLNQYRGLLNLYKLSKSIDYWKSWQLNWHEDELIQELEIKTIDRRFHWCNAISIKTHCKGWHSLASGLKFPDF